MDLAVLQDGKVDENPKLARARQRTRARFESLLQAAASEGMLDQTGKTKKKQRSKTGETLLSELKSGRHILKERSKSEERLLNDNLYKEAWFVLVLSLSELPCNVTQNFAVIFFLNCKDVSPKFKKKRAKDVLLDSNEDAKQVELPQEDESLTKPRKQRKKKSRNLSDKQRKNVGEDFVSNDLVDGAGKENVAYEGSPERQNDGEKVVGENQTKKKKKKKQNKGLKFIAKLPGKPSKGHSKRSEETMVCSNFDFLSCPENT
eukprot:gene4723-5346_t